MKLSKKRGLLPITHSPPPPPVSEIAEMENNQPEQKQPFQNAKIRKVEFLPPVEIPIEGAIQKRFFKQREAMTMAATMEAEAAEHEKKSQQIRQAAHNLKVKALNSGEELVELLLEQHKMTGKRYSLMPELDKLIVDIN